jgi:hypothetical protein
VVVITGGALIVILSSLELDPAAFVAVKVKANVPAAVGVPLMTPVEDKESPASSVPLWMLHVIGAVPLAVRVCV